MRTDEQREKARDYCARNREARRKLNNEWISKNREKYNRSKHKFRLKVKVTVMAMYASPIRCVSCGFNDIDGLTLDHIHDNGADHRKALKLSHRGASVSGGRIYEYIYKHGKIDGMQVLCANCNLIKQIKRGRAKTFSNDPILLAEVEQMYANYTAK